jgi:hypothetical protein
MISNQTAEAGVVSFAEVPAVPLQVNSQYLGVSNGFSVDPSQSPSLTVTIALSYPIYGLVALAAGTIAVGMFIARHRRIKV